MGPSAPLHDSFLQQELGLYCKLVNVDFGPKVKYVLRPINYAFEIHKDFLTKYCVSPKKVLFLGMNPGPWGMMQNAVPFGEGSSVREFLGVVGSVQTPQHYHPSRPISGLSCTRSEVSGKRFWSLASMLGAGSAARFFENGFVHNYFPFCLLDEKGKNLTPPELRGLKPGVKNYIDSVCSCSLIETLNLLHIEVVVAIGRYVEAKVTNILKTANSPVKEQRKWMKAAIDLAEQALVNREVPVGCIFIRGNEIVARGRNDVNRTRNATRHAEMICIDEVFARFNNVETFKDVSVVVTVEPCIMCAAALHDLAVQQIAFGCANDRFGGCGSVFDVTSIHSSPVPVVGGLFADKAMHLLKTFYLGVNPNAPPSKVKTRKKRICSK